MLDTPLHEVGNAKGTALKWQIIEISQGSLMQ